jgi:hypothetical protein
VERFRPGLAAAGWIRHIRQPGELDDEAKPSVNSFASPNEAPLDVPGSPSTGGWATSYLLPQVGRELFSGSVHRPDANRQPRCARRSDDTDARHS